MSDDIRWPSEVRGSHKLVAWLNRLLRACQKSAIREIKVVGGVGKIQNGSAIISFQPGSTGINWQEPYKELDPTLSVPKDTLVYITTNNALVTTGSTDLQLMVNQLACEGIWCAAKDVPATNGGNYNVPTFPYPSATGTPTGSAGAIKGDLDGDDTYDIYWIYLGQMNCA